MEFSPSSTVIFRVTGTLLALFNLGTFSNICQETILGGLANATGNSAVFGNGVLQQIAHHDVLIALRIIRIGLQIIVDCLEGIHTIIVICIDNGEGSINNFACCQCGVCSTPGLGSSFRNSVTLRQVSADLMDILNIHLSSYIRADDFFECFFQLGFNDKHSSTETSSVSIKQGVVDNDVAIFVHWVDLLQTTVAATHTGSHYNKNRCIHGRFLQTYLYRGP